MIFIFLLASLLVASDGYAVESQDNNATDWTYFMLVQRWPFAVCQIVNASGHSCMIPTLVKGWTIHGLWPSGVGAYPSYCHDWKFDMMQVEDIEYDLLRLWPNLYVNETVDSLWKHEYEKHGTCAVDVHGFEAQHDYFKRTLEMLPKYDVQSVLEHQSIYPRKEGYKKNEIVDKIKGAFNKRVCPGCGNVQGVGQVLSQSYVCINKLTLQQMDCPSPCWRECNPDEDILYQPLHST